MKLAQVNHSIVSTLKSEELTGKRLFAATEIHTLKSERKTWVGVDLVGCSAGDTVLLSFGNPGMAGAHGLIDCWIVAIVEKGGNGNAKP